MTLETLVHLARSRTPADRGRIQLATAAFGLSGAFLLIFTGAFYSLLRS